jgi:hypothetical protein
MVAGRKMHDFPHGIPRALVVTEIVFAAAFFGLLIFGAVTESWRHAAPFIVVIVAAIFVYSKLLRTYELTGQAVPISRPKVIVKFPAGLPIPLIGTRVAFFGTVAIMGWFGVGAATDAIARVGIVMCVFLLIGVVVMNNVLERHYVSTGRAAEVDLSMRSADRNNG